MKISHGAWTGAQRRNAYLKENLNRLCADADTHISRPGCEMKRLRSANDSTYFHGRAMSAEQLVAEMDSCGVDVSLCWQNPAATRYCGDRTADFEALLDSNRYIYESCQSYPQRLVPGGWTDPKALGVEKAKELVELCVKQFGFSIVKLNPAQNGYPIDSPPVIEVTDLIVSLGATPAFHYGADTEFTPASGLEALAQRHETHPIIAVHMGGGGAGYVESEQLYHDTRALGLRCPNLHFPLSARRETHTLSDLIAFQAEGEPYALNLSCASDAPYGLQAWNFGGYREIFRAARTESMGRTAYPDALRLFDEEAERNFLGRNFLRLAIRSHERVKEALGVSSATKSSTK